MFAIIFVYMICSLCRTGECQEGHTTMTLSRGEAVIVIKHVPALVCQQCGHAYLDKETTKMVLQKANRAIENGSELEVINLKAA